MKFHKKLITLLGEVGLVYEAFDEVKADPIIEIIKKRGSALNSRGVGYMIEIGVKENLPVLSVDTFNDIRKGVNYESVLLKRSSKCIKLCFNSSCQIKAPKVRGFIVFLGLITLYDICFYDVVRNILRLIIMHRLMK